MLTKNEKTQFVKLRKRAIAADFPNLNPQQIEGVLTTEGPLLLLAGAGSGKTTVLINRVANLIQYGRGSDSDDVPDFVTTEDIAWLEDYLSSPYAEGREYAEHLCRLDPAPPWTIIAITFTNKAAGELQERLGRKLGEQADGVWACTFHSACLRILRRDIERLGFSSSFTIYDTADSERVIKDILKDLHIDEKTLQPRSILSRISRIKDEMLLSADYEERVQNSGDYIQKRIAEIYREYEHRLWDANALDFDDIILHTVRLLLQYKDVREYYQNKFRYILIDEYQDTNHLQYLFAATLAGERKNICVVGDDDQSIYRFRGATIENILSFESQFKGCRTIRLEQNYRSTANILEAANAVIRNNRSRKGKRLWTDKEGGEKIGVYTAMNEQDEAEYVASSILEDYQNGTEWNSNAVLYRMNVQSRVIENAFKMNGIPYRIIGGTRFFDRAEVKDMLAYLCVVNNTSDDLRLMRILNVPARGIGAKTVAAIQQIAQKEQLSYFEVIKNAEQYEILQKSAPKLRAFAELIEGLRDLEKQIELPEFYDKVIERSGYGKMLERKNTVEDRTRLENVNELKTSIYGYIENTDGEADLSGFLDEIALYTDLDDQSPDENCVVMMTMHSAKGLEFSNVYLVGIEEGIFPGIRAIGEEEEMEEERRLCYVAMTRAKKKLNISLASQRMLFGHTNNNLPSRFVREIPEELIEFSSWKGEGEEGTSWGQSESYNRDVFDSDRVWERPKRPSVTPSISARKSYSSRISMEKNNRTEIPDYQKGDMVEHKAFGKGMIISIMQLKGDALVEIAFDNVGTKRLLLKSASQFMKKIG